jgi:hypothetical protein
MGAEGYEKELKRNRHKRLSPEWQEILRKAGGVI